MKSRERLKKILEENESFLILTHFKPDGDAVGSLLALYYVLHGLGKKVEAFTDEIPEMYANLEGIDFISSSRDFDGNKQYDVCFVLDSSNAERGLVNKLNNNTVIVNIDHHVDNSLFGDLNIVNSTAAATGSIIYKKFKELCIELTPAIASALYVAIMTDTGRFSYSNTDADTFSIISDLVEAGASPAELTDQVYKDYSFRRATLFGSVLNSLESHRKGKIATIELPFDTVRALEVKPYETDGFMDYIQGIREADVSIFFKQLSLDAVNVSLRSKGKVDVRKIASHFDGGGHKFASGCTVYSDLEDAKKLIIKECVKQLQHN